LEWCALGQEQIKFLELLMDEDPSKRPTAEVALKIVMQFEQQYLN